MGIDKINDEYQNLLMALKIFSVRSISASNVALHLPFSSSPLSNFEGLPSFLSKFLYSTSSRLFSALRALISCSLLIKSDYNLLFSSLKTFLIWSTSLSLMASNSTLICSRIWTVYLLETVWS